MVVTGAHDPVRFGTYGTTSMPVAVELGRKYVNQVNKSPTIGHNSSHFCLSIYPSTLTVAIDGASYFFQHIYPYQRNIREP